ncbi:hypothetical protein BDP55DRAFT_21620 [Colletotrichum godetiae]|uniref:Uncharacterized protein n=1 Tax=Colletotrichum godetiae TaxID=1209918 RepID=A0AAJ0B2I0_9PEZI|nr:uncharacterized protein BDP55DRAFT_21620 [Colletotrichum godetiae]KAK1701451.1 hypothetical protein BDP55DRAFT_21620 [Colletotrichum godetiae]
MLVSVTWGLCTRSTALDLLSQLRLPVNLPSRSKPAGHLVGTISGRRLDLVCLTWLSIPCIPVCHGSDKGRLSLAKVAMELSGATAIHHFGLVRAGASPTGPNLALAETMCTKPQGISHGSSTSEANRSPISPRCSHRSLPGH